MEIFTTGYQWGAHMQYIGTYQIFHQEDQPIHMPPNTTLIEPPTVDEGQEAIWDGKNWKLVDIPGFIKPDEINPQEPTLNTEEPTSGA